MAKTKKTRSKIRSKIEAIKKINDNPKQAVNDTYDLIKDDINVGSKINRKIDDYKTKRKAKKTDQDNVLETMLNTVEGFLDTSKNANTKDKPFVQKKLIRYSKDSASETMKSAKQIVLDAVQNKLFAGDSACGVNNFLPANTVTISPKEIDFLDMLKIDPDTNMGSIMYETTVDKGFVKMNREFYTNFDSNSPYLFEKNNGEELFNMTWDDTAQYFIISGLTGTTGMTVTNFIGEYYNRIEQVDTETIFKQAMLMTIQGDGNEPESFNIRMDWLNRILNKLFSICGQKQKDKPLNQNNTNLIGDDDVDLEWYFDFDDVEGVDIDDEDARRRRVLKFKDCDNFEILVNPAHIEDFIYFSNKENVETTVSNVLNAISTEACEDSGQRFSINDLQISISFKYILNVAKAIVAGVISPKIFFPIVTSYKILKSMNLTAEEFFKRLKNMFYEIIKNLFWKFIQGLWKYIKKDLLNFLQEIALTILKNKLKRYKAILSALISLLTTILQTGFQSCEDIFEAILSVIELALSSKTKLPIPSILLVLSDQLPGYSTDRAYMNITERLTVAGIDMEPIYGVENKTHSLIKSIIDGNSEEEDNNSYILATAKPTILASAPGGTVVAPGTLTIVGKKF